MSDDDYGIIAESIGVHQLRFLLGRLTSSCDEVGIWGAFGLQDDELDEFGPRLEVEPQDQLNLYWRRYFPFGGETMLYSGLADPNLEVPGFINDDNELTELVIGLRGTAPLSCNLGLFGGFHYVIPSASGDGDSPFGSLEESWNVTFGVMWVRGCSLPVLPVADNGWFGKRLFFQGGDL
jgi:hypothetical protein